MNTQKICCTVLTILVVLVFFVTIQRLYENKKKIQDDFDDIVEMFAQGDAVEPPATTATSTATTTAANNADQEKDSKLDDSQLKTLGNIVDNSKLERERWSRNFFDHQDKQEDDFRKHSNILNQIIKEREDLKGVVEQSKKEISDHSTKFTEGIQQLGEFHNNYQKELDNILLRKKDLTNNVYNMRQKIQDSRLIKLQKEYEKIAQLRQQLTNQSDNESRSIKCLGTGDRLNIHPIKPHRNPTGKYAIFLNRNPDNSDAGCLRYVKPKEYMTDVCQLDDSHQQYNINTITNYNEYNDLIDNINDGTKKLVFESDNIVYPFKVVSPLENRGMCLNIEDGNVSIEPCRDTANQRFSNSQVPYSQRNCDTST